jgi:fatty-acyl-CoA synthase
MTSAINRQTLGDLLRRTRQRDPGKIAIRCGATQWTYAEFDDTATRLAAGLASLGVQMGDRVAVMARNSHAFAALRFAVARLGAVLVPINFMLNSTETKFILDHSGATLVCVDTGLAALVQQASVDTAVRQLVWLPGEDASEPVAGLVSFDELLQKGEHLTETGLHGAMPALYVGATSVITSKPVADNLLMLIAREGITSFFAPPTVWISLLRAPQLETTDHSRLAKGYYGASIMPVEVLKEIQRRLPQVRLWNLYGQTEIAPVATVLKPEDQLRKAGSAGKQALNVETRIVDDAMQDVATGEIGEIVHRSPQLLSGYYRDEEKTRAAFEGGWFHSGDLGVMDDEGYITVVDRKKDMIKSGGENVASREVEEALYTIEGVSEVAVIGLPDPRWIEAVTAIVVAKPGAQLTEAGIIAACATRLAHFKVPKRVFLTDALPKNPSGKLLKRELRLRYAPA